MGSKPGFFDLGFRAAYSRLPESTDLDAWGVSDVAPALPGEPARVTGRDPDDLMVEEAGEAYSANRDTAGAPLPSPAMPELPEKRRSSSFVLILSLAALAIGAFLVTRVKPREALPPIIVGHVRPTPKR